MSGALSRIAPTAARFLLGGIFFVFGLNGFLQFLAAPPMPAKALAFAAALGATGYMFPLIKGIEVIAGLLLLSNRFVPLALTLLAPIIVNIALFHTVLAPGLGMVVVLLATEIFLAWSYRKAFAPMLASRVAPSTTRSEADIASAVPAE